MNIITLTTDFGEKDYSVGALKGQLYSLIPQARVVDISHQIEPYNILQASYILKNSYKYFPKNTIHIIGIDNELSVDKKLLILRHFDQFFICADNGFISLFTNETESVKEIYSVPTSTNSCFPTLDFSTKVAQKISQGIPLNQIGQITENHLIKTDFSLIIKSDRIEGSVIYIDHYGNAVSNISKNLIEKTAAGRRFDVFFRFYKFSNISAEEIFTQYNAFEQTKRSNLEGEKFILFNHAQHLELAIYRSNLKTTGGASTLLGIHNKDLVSVNFINP